MALIHLCWVRTLLLYLSNQIRHMLSLSQEIIHMPQMYLKIILPYLHTCQGNIGYVEKGHSRIYPQPELKSVF